MKNKALSVHMNIEAAIAARVQVSDLSFELAKLIVERGIKPIDGGVVWRSDSRVKTTSPYRLSPKQADQIFHDLAIPTQLIYGDQGMSFVSAALTRYQSSKSSLDSHSLAGGHHVHMEQPEQCAALIKSFFHKK